MITGKMVTYNMGIVEEGDGREEFCVWEEHTYLDNNITPVHLQPEDY